MKEFRLTAPEGQWLSREEVSAAAAESVREYVGSGKKILLVIPDYTRYHSNAGLIANTIYHTLEGGCHVDLLQALGTHFPMTEAECADMYGDIPFARFIPHNWRSDIVKLGQVPAEFISEVSEGLWNTPIDVEVNHLLVDGGYDLILSIGQVVPHEVVGMANQSKNIFVGVGGASMINSSHSLGAFYGMERMMGRDKTPVRQVFDYAKEHFLADLPLHFILTVNTAPGGEIHTHGLFIGAERSFFEDAVALAQKTNLTLVDEPMKKVVVYLNAEEFKSTWLGNKSVYRTRMAIADGGELIVLAPGVETFGEDKEIDRLIRKYGYCGREKIIQLCETEPELQANMSAAAHLIHGSSDGRFSITYCTEKATKEDIEGVCFGYEPYSEAIKRYNPATLTDGWHTLPDDEEFFYISNPALGLWAHKAKFEN
ncbi:MAG: DUF2088 domain-containing protein [Oscillospiraceae bacterium]|nr:DUF2088 domain-containing protein [Oscillospiraceae bacterium]